VTRDLALATVDEALAAARAHWDRNGSPQDHHLLRLMKAVESLRGQLRPDPREADSWCGEGAAHEHEACGLRWDSSDPRDKARAGAWLADQADARDLRVLFEMQWDRTAEASARWRAADPDIRDMTMPDLGVLVSWLMAEADTARAETQALRTQLHGTRPQPDGDPAPVFVLRGRDELAPVIVHQYRELCDEAGLPDQAHQVGLALDEIIEWQDRHPDLVGLPTHLHTPVNAG
jgi:hypothetical protein